MIVVQKRDGTLLFLREDGTVLGSHKLSSQQLFFNDSAVADGKFWYIDSSGQHLHSLSSDGTDTDVAGLAEASRNLISGLAVSPDGARWAWGVQLASVGSNTRTHIDIAGPGAATQTALDEATNNPVLTPIAWTSQGILVERENIGIGGCCYIKPEAAGRDAMLVDPSSLQVTGTWTGCATTSASATGSFACVSDKPPAVVVHRGSPVAVTITPLSPVVEVGWAFVDDADSRVVFAVVHSLGNGGGDGPYVIDTESGDLSNGKVTKLVAQQTPEAVLADGSIVVSSAPAAPSSGIPSTVSLLTPAGSLQRLGPSGVQFVAAFTLGG